MSSSGLAAMALVAVAFMHSFLGETRLIRPLLAQSWTVAVPRPAADHILRFAWHLTSLAWLSLAAILAGADSGTVVGLLSLVSAGVVLATLRSHPAWPIFLIAGLAALDGAGALPSWIRSAGGVAASLGLLAAAVLHGYWLSGGSWLLDRALPTKPLETAAEAGDRATLRPIGRPGRAATALVAALLVVMAIIVAAETIGVGRPIGRIAGWVGVAAMGLRIIGDGRYVGFTKSVRSTPFARADDRAFTPVIVLLALGCAGGLLAVT